MVLPEGSSTDRMVRRVVNWASGRRKKKKALALIGNPVPGRVKRKKGESVKWRVEKLKRVITATVKIWVLLEIMFWILKVEIGGFSFFSLISCTKFEMLFYSLHQGFSV